MNANEFYHHGIKGMKWGVRRFQNKDGSLTDAGKKRRGSESDSTKGLFGRKKAKSEAPSKTKEPTDQEKAKPVESKKKSINELSDDELRNKVNRLQMEKQAMDLERQISALNPKRVSRGQKFAEHIGGKILGPAATDAAKASLTKYLTKTMSNSLGVGEGEARDKLKILERDFKIKNFKKQIHELEMYFEAERNAGRMS